MKYLLLILLAINFGYTTTALAQNQPKANDETEAVKDVVNNLFKAMYHVDTVLLKSLFTDNAILQTVAKNKDNQVVVKTESLKEMVGFVGKSNVGQADEKVTFDMIKIDGALASVWTPYNFYFNNKFSHCGANSFQLVKISGSWKILHLLDTRRRENCN